MIYEYLFNKHNYEQSLNNFAEYLKVLNLTKDTILVKVNWSNTKKGYITDNATLKFLIKGLKLAYKNVKIIVLEAYSYERNDPYLEKHHDADITRKGIIRQNEKKFLEEHKFNQLFTDEDVTYINVTEEIWSNRNTDPKKIKQIVKSKYDYNITNEELYNQIPESIFQYKGKSLISFAKIKGIILPGFLFFTMSMKNLFGLIPKTCRRNYHGKPKLNNTIIDMNVIYKSLFDVVGINEAVFNTLFIGQEHYIIENSGCMAASRDLLTLDAAVIHSLSFNPFDRHFVKMSEPVFNPVNKNLLDLNTIKKEFYPLLDEKINIEKTKKSKEKVNFII